jgi:hypothetical protein
METASLLRPFIFNFLQRSAARFQQVFNVSTAKVINYNPVVIAQDYVQQNPAIHTNPDKGNLVRHGFRAANDYHPI